MTVTPAGWYPDPENPGARRYWSGTAWAAPVPAKKKASASKVLAGFAIGVGALGPLSIGGGMLLGVAGLSLATLFGMPDPGAVAVDALLRWAAGGAAVGVPFVVIGLLLAVLATTRRDRARVPVIVAWIVVGFGLVAVPLFLFAAEPIAL